MFPNGCFTVIVAAVIVPVALGLAMWFVYVT